MFRSPTRIQPTWTAMPCSTLGSAVACARCLRRMDDFAQAGNGANPFTCLVDEFRHSRAQWELVCPHPSWGRRRGTRPPRSAPPSISRRRPKQRFMAFETRTSRMREARPVTACAGRRRRRTISQVSSRGPAPSSSRRRSRIDKTVRMSAFGTRTPTDSRSMAPLRATLRRSGGARRYTRGLRGDQRGRKNAARRLEDVSDRDTGRRHIARVISVFCFGRAKATGM